MCEGLVCLNTVPQIWGLRSVYLWLSSFPPLSPSALCKLEDVAFIFPNGINTSHSFFFHPDKLISISKHYNIVKQLRAAIVTNLSGALSTPSMKNNKLCCSNKEVFINHETGLELCALWKKTTFLLLLERFMLQTSLGGKKRETRF